MEEHEREETLTNEEENLEEIPLEAQQQAAATDGASSPPSSAILGETVREAVETVVTKKVPSREGTTLALPPETAKETPLSPPALRRKETVTPVVVRKRNSAAGSVAKKNITSSAQSSEEELFEDEPDLPRASPRRIAARTARRRKPRRRSSLGKENESVATEESPPMFPALPTPAARDFADDSSHWSSSDAEDEMPPGDVPWLSRDDIEICQRLDDEYEVALEDREVVYTARYNSVRQSACFSVFFMIFYLSLGTVFFMRQAQWTVQESILFSIYTITTVGYGTLETPETPAFQLYTIFFIFVGIATLTIMVAQIYQCVALEASRAEHAREHTKLARYQTEGLTRSVSPRMASASSAQENEGNGQAPRIAQQLMAEMNIPNHWIDHIFGCMDRTKLFLTTTEVGRGISVVLPFLGLILVGAMVVGTIEGWGIVESLYFAVVSLTTVGFGDYVPTTDASILFCIIWLPCSIGFMSLFLANVAAFYIRLSDKNIARIERQLRKQVKYAKDIARKEREAAKRRALRGQAQATAVRPGSGDHSQDEDGDVGHTNSRRKDSEDTEHADGLATEEGENLHLFGSPEQIGQEEATRREKILMNYRGQWEREDGAESDGSGDSLLRKGKGLSTMKDMLRAVHANRPTESSRMFQQQSGPEHEILSVRSNSYMDSHALRQGSLRKPSFALRALVQERFAEIVAAEVAGYESSIEIKDNSLRVAIDTLRHTASKWMIPRRARRAFRAVAFEALYFVGEHGLITRGADALFDLSPLEFHRLFTPLLAALGDADSMESWLASTDILAEVDLNRTSTSSPPQSDRQTRQLNRVPSQEQE